MTVAEGGVFRLNKVQSFCVWTGIEKMEEWSTYQRNIIWKEKFVFRRFNQLLKVLLETDVAN